jgi:hypothetical protein
LSINASNVEVKELVINRFGGTGNRILNNRKDPSGFGEGQEYMGERRVTTDRDGRASFTFKTGDITGAFVTATATRLDPTTLLPTDTSEFSAAK